MNKRGFIRIISLLFVYVTLLLVSKPRAVVAIANIIPVSNNHYYSTCPVIFPPSTSTPAPQIKYDVFVSFRGSDIRKSFLSHVLEALSRKQIVVFSDKKLRGGDEISELFRAIEKSFISLVIFSPNFASSHWCLDELVKIAECTAKYGRILLPVFYQVDPSDVRHQNGTYRDAFAQHEKQYNLDKVLSWRSALKQSANMSGFDSSHFLDDAKLVEEIVQNVLRKLNQVDEGKSKGLVGIEKQISPIESLLHLESEDVRVLGIWGMPGIGKTTLAEEVFRRLRSKYESCCFMANVREETERYGTNSLRLRKNLLSTLLEEENLKDDMINGLPPLVKKRLRRMKVLIVLDDVKDAEQLEVLVGVVDWLGAGSRIIITTRDKQVLAGKVDDIYEVEPLDSAESFQLFNLHAFTKHEHLEIDYYKLSKKMVDYSKGVPLVLKALANLLCGKDKDIWESQARILLTRIEQIENVHDVFRLIYANLDYHEKNIFLDIACFFDGLKLKLDLIKLLLKDRHYSVSTKLDRLKDKALVTISQQSIVSMHDIIQETAWEIVRQESVDEPGSRSRLLDPDDIYHVLKDDKQGGEAIRSMAIRLSEIKELQLSPQAFARMSKLKYLDIYTKESKNEGSLSLPRGLEFLPNELRYLRWEYYPLESLPSMFSAENLVTLSLPYSRLKKLWHGEKDLVNLNVLILSSSTLLTELPDFSKATSLAVLDLQFLVGLTSVHPSVFSLRNLKNLDLSGCLRIRDFQSNNTHLSSLTHLSLYNCTELKEFSVTSKHMNELNLERTSIKKLPSSIGLQNKLETLHLGHTHIQSLPKSIKHLTMLRHLDLHHCSELQTLPELPPSLETLEAGGCVLLENVAFRSTVSEQLKEKKKKVTFWNCIKLNEPSLEAIKLNAQINMMKFSHQHISTWDRDRDHNHNHNRNQGMYVYPGSEIPEWLDYSTTTHEFITIDLSSAPYFSKLGFIFGFIIPTISSEGSIFKFKISDGDSEDEGINVYLDRPHHGIESDHVYLMYDPRCSHYLASRVNDQSKIKIQVRVASRTPTSQYVPVQLRGFAVSLVTPSQYDKFKQQLEFGDGSVVPNNMCSMEEGSMFLGITLCIFFALLSI